MRGFHFVHNLDDNGRALLNTENLKLEVLAFRFGCDLEMADTSRATIVMRVRSGVGSSSKVPTPDLTLGVWSIEPVSCPHALGYL